MDESHEKQLTETTEQNFLISPSLPFECGLAMRIAMLHMCVQFVRLLLQFPPEIKWHNYYFLCCMQHNTLQE